jgi:hypothetical protein
MARHTIDMNRQKWIILVAALGLMGSAAGLLRQLQANQKLGHPAVKTRPIAGGQRLQVDLPEQVLDYTGEPLDVDQLTLDTLPQDTSFGGRRYTAPDGFSTQVNVVLMGSDRTSLHKTEFCLEGAGWHINQRASAETKVHLDRPYAYDLPVTKYIATREVNVDGQKRVIQGVYVRWFVADKDEYTARHWQRMWWMARDLFQTGVLQRWAMISYFSACLPGQEDLTFERMKKFIAASAPEFQLVPRPKGTTLTARP